MMFNRLQRYWHTLRYLRPVQVYGRIWFRLYRPRVDLRPAPEMRSRVRAWVVPGLRPRSMLGPTQFRFLQQTHSVDAPGAWNDPRRDKLWLYNLHYFDDLNAFDAQTREEWHRALIERWIAENPPGQGNGWEPYPTSLRIVNWVKWALRRAPGTLNESLLHGEQNAAGGDFRHSLAVQTRWLRRRLEHHLLGNHLFTNAKALVFSGAFFVGPEARRWLVLGQRLLVRELQEQILPDGGHFERSPMYHAILLEDVLDLLHLADLFPQTLDARLVSDCRECAGTMLAWLGAMTHPDGEIGFFNDAAFGIAPSPGQLARYAEAVNVAPVGPYGVDRVAPALSGSPVETMPHVGTRAVAVISPGDAAVSLARDSRASAVGTDPESGIQTAPGDGTERVAVVPLRDSGYLRVEAGPAVALLDVAAIGPDYLPGHAHADTLSFEWSLFGQRVIVNGGTSRYGSGPERLAQRGTAAHSTVQIDGVDSSEVWGGFRVARRAKPLDVYVEHCVSADVVGKHLHVPGETQGGCVWREACALQRYFPRPSSRVRVSAAHDGYRRLRGRPVHRRSWEISPGRLLVSDRIEGKCGKAVARFHLHPDVGVEFQDRDAGTAGILRLPSGKTCQWRLAGGQVELCPGLWHPEFGCSLPNQCLVLHLNSDSATLELLWDP